MPLRSHIVVRIVQLQGVKAEPKLAEVRKRKTETIITEKIIS